MNSHEHWITHTIIIRTHAHKKDHCILSSVDHTNAMNASCNCASYCEKANSSYILSTRSRNNCPMNDFSRNKPPIRNSTFHSSINFAAQRNTLPSPGLLKPVEMWPLQLLSITLLFQEMMYRFRSSRRNKVLSAACAARATDHPYCYNSDFSDGTLWSADYACYAWRLKAATV